MSDLKRQLQDFAEKNADEILSRFNDVLNGHPETAGLRVAKAKISYAEARDKDGPTIEPVEGGYIIWK